MITQTPWFERKFDFNFPTGLFPIILERLRGTVFQLEGTIKSIPEEQLIIKKDGKWSVKEVIGHLYDLEELWWKRLQDFMDAKEVLSAADLTNRKTTEAKHNEKTLEELLQLFTLERQRTLEGIYHFDERTLLKTSVHPRLQQPMRLIDALYFVAEHDDHHIAIISSLLRKPVG